MTFSVHGQRYGEPWYYSLSVMSSVSVLPDFLCYRCPRNSGVCSMEYYMDGWGRASNVVCIAEALEMLSNCLLGVCKVCSSSSNELVKLNAGREPSDAGPR